MKISTCKLVFLLAILSVQALCQTNQADKYWRKAEDLSIAGKYAESLEYYQRAYQLVEKTDPIRSANLCNDISSAYFADGNYEISLQYCHKGLKHIEKKTGIPDSLFFKLYSSTGTMFNGLKQRDSAYFYFQWADAVLDRSPVVEQDIPLYVLHHYLHQGRAFWALHRYHQSIAYFIKAKRLSERYHLIDELDYIESSLAEGYDLLGQHREALEHRLNATEYRLLSPKRKQELYLGVAYTYNKLNLPDSALIWQNQSWKQHLLQQKDTFHYKREHLRLLFVMSSCYRQKGQLNKAENYLDMAIAYHSKVFPNERWIKANILIEKGKIAYLRAELVQSESLYMEAFKVSSLSSSFDSIHPIDLVYPQVAFLALYLKASLLSKKYQSSNNLTDLLASYQSFKELIDLKRISFYEASQDIEERQFMSNESYDVFKEAIPLAYELYNKNNSPIILQEIFNWFEDANVSYLFETIRDKNINNKNVPPELLAKEQELIQKRAVLAAGTNNPSSSNERQLNELRVEWYKLRQSIKEKYTSGLITSHEPIKISEVKNKLDKKSAFISYKWLGDNLYIYVITRETTRLIKLPVNSKFLSTQLQILQNEIYKNPGFKKYAASEQAIECYKVLFEPLKKWIPGKTRLIMARDWQFNFLPLELLETGKTTNDYLVKHYAISYTYSASLFWQHPSLSNTKLLSRVNFNKANSSLTIAPFVKQDTSGKIGGFDPILNLDDLAQLGGESLWGERATKQQFLKNGFDYPVLNLATHAEAEDENPDDSFIQFYPGVDSRLYLNELYTLPLHSTRLMILSACSAGKGKNVWGEGNISLAHAIAQAGCPSLATTVWEANNEVINYLSLRFHKHLKEGEFSDQAIHMARMDFFKSEIANKYAHPYYWANFVLIGNNEPVYSKSIFYETSAVMISGGGILFLLCVFVLVKMRQRSKVMA